MKRSKFASADLRSLWSRTKNPRALSPRSFNRPLETKVSARLPSDSSWILLLAASVLIILAILIYFLSVETGQKVLAEATIQDILVPVKKEEAPALDFSARAVYVSDVGSGKVLFAKNPVEPLLPASTTKIATALVALKYYKDEDILKVSDTKKVVGQKMGLVNGEEIRSLDLIKGLLIYSANDAAEVLARGFASGEPAFVEEMNKLARDAGLENTHFTNPAGYDEYLHFSTAEDLAKLALFAYQNPEFAQIVGTKEAEVTSVDAKKVHKLESTNELLGEVDGVLGIKTGHTSSSGESLVTLVSRDNHKVLIVILGSSDRFGETRKLINWVFTNFSWQTKRVPRSF